MDHIHCLLVSVDGQIRRGQTHSEGVSSVQFDYTKLSP